MQLRRLTLLLAATAAAVFATTAAAGQALRETIHVEDTFVETNFCDIPGLTVRTSLVLDIRVHAVPHGPDGLLYFVQHGTERDVFTNVANGKSLTSVVLVNEKDKRITDNGDGTLTILIMATGNATLYGANGKAIARNPGQLRFGLLIDHGGTPNDPSDDEVIEDLGVTKGSTGRSDDFCAAAVAGLR
jgi:hypothetical protein